MIRAEHARARPLTAADVRAFMTDGVPAPALSWTPSGRVSMVARERVLFEGKRFEFARYRPEADAVNAYTVPLLDAEGEPADILAWRPGSPVALWNGAVSVAGEEQVLAPRLSEALDVHEDVLGWLRAGREGILILSPARAAETLSGALLRARTAEHARYLRASLARPAPRIVVAETVAQAA